MKVKLLVIALVSFLCVYYCYSQEKENVSTLDNEVDRLSTEMVSLQNKYKVQAQEIKQLNAVAQMQQTLIDSLESSLEENKLEISAVHQASVDSLNATKQCVSDTAQKLTSYTNVRVMYAALLGLLSLVLLICIYYIYSKKTKRNSELINSFAGNLTRLEQERMELDKGIASSDSKLFELIERQIASAEETRHEAKEPDHSLAIAVANELTRIQQNLNHMDSSVKGVSQLRNRAKAILTTLNSKQYEVPDMLGRTYHDGDNMIATMELNEEMPVGTNRIKRVIKPQVSYAGKMIQAAEVVVEFNE
ncbi:MAG: hypothetical protein LUC86_01480 [Prevotellaceae bacterium]|nr:hypothetical protein [Prevotellaceae bacterium]